MDETISAAAADPLSVVHTDSPASGRRYHAPAVPVDDRHLVQAATEVIAWPPTLFPSIRPGTTTGT